MTTMESSAAQSIESALARIGHAVDPQELERAWCEGLRCHRDLADRDRILAEAGARLGVFDEAACEPLRRSWLRQLAEEIRLRADQLSTEFAQALVSRGNLLWHWFQSP